MDVYTTTADCPSNQITSATSLIGDVVSFHRCAPGWDVAQAQLEQYGGKGDGKPEEQAPGWLKKAARLLEEWLFDESEVRDPSWRI